MDFNLDTLEGFGANPTTRRVVFFTKDGDGEIEHTFSCSMAGLAALLSASFQASQQLADITGGEPDLPDIPLTAVMHPTQLDVRRSPKSDGSVVFQAGTTALEVKLDSLALDMLTQLLNQRR